MALKDNFYEEIFEREKKWIKMINKDLLNAIYCNLDLKPFYIEKKETIQLEYESTKNPVLKEALLMLESIIKKLNEFKYEYENSRYINTKSLIPLFLINRMSNNFTNNKIENLKQEKLVLEQTRNYIKGPNELEDYVYEDFPDDYKKAI